VWGRARILAADTRRAFVLFSDRIPAGALAGGPQRALDDPDDAYAKVMLARLSVALEDPLP